MVYIEVLYMQTIHTHFIFIFTLIPPGLRRSPVKRVPSINFMTHFMSVKLV